MNRETSFIVTRYGVEVDLSEEGKTGCPRCQKKYGRDKNNDNLAVYGLDENNKHKGAFCFSCEYVIPSQQWLEDNGEVQEEEYELVGTEFNEEIHEKLKQRTGIDPKGYRGLSREVCSYFGVRHEYSEEDGSVVAQYYPNTRGGQLVGYKKRIANPKGFAAIGETGRDCDLFGWFRFKNSSGKLPIA